MGQGAFPWITVPPTWQATGAQGQKGIRERILPYAWEIGKSLSPLSRDLNLGDLELEQSMDVVM